MGRDFEGQPIAVGADRFGLRVRADAGEVEFSFARDEVLRLRFPGNALKQRAFDLAADDRLAEALTVVDRLFVQRSRFFPYTGETEARFFVETLGFYRQADRVYEGLARAEVLLPFLQDEAIRRAVEREQLLGYYQAGLVDEAAPLARAWIDRQGRIPESALPWVILAQLQVAAGEGDAAMFTLLEPLVFSGARNLDGLDLAYAMAIELARVLERDSLAEDLAAERVQRNLTAPLTWAPLAAPDFSPLTTLPPPS